MDRASESFEYESLRAQSQEILLDCLRADLELGRTFAQSALLAKTDVKIRLKGAAVTAAKTVRQFLTRIPDPEMKAEISEKLAELDRLISTV